MSVHPLAEGALVVWHDKTRKAKWQTSQDVKGTFPSADQVGGKRYVINVKGNHYRIVIGIDFVRSIVFIKFIGTHAEYDTIDAATVEHT